MIKQLLLEAPDSQLDVSIKPLIEKWSEPPTALEVLEVIDQVVYSGLGSDFVVNVLDILLRKAIAGESTTMELVIEQAHWRK